MSDIEDVEGALQSEEEIDAEPKAVDDRLGGDPGEAAKDAAEPPTVETVENPEGVPVTEAPASNEPAATDAVASNGRAKDAVETEVGVADAGAIDASGAETTAAATEATKSEAKKPVEQKVVEEKEVRAYKTIKILVSFKDTLFFMSAGIMRRNLSNVHILSKLLSTLPVSDLAGV